MEYIPHEQTLKYVLNENGTFVTREIWYNRGNFFLTGTELELMTTPINTDAPFDSVVIRLTQELKQISMYIPNLELAISLVEAYMTLPYDVTDTLNGPISNEIIDRVCYRLSPIELDILSVNNLSKHPVSGDGDALDMMIIVRQSLTLVHHKLFNLRSQGYYFGCVNTETFDILLVKPY